MDGWKEHSVGARGWWLDGESGCRVAHRESRHIGRVGTWGGADGEVGGWRGGWLMGPWTRYASIELVN